MKRLLTAVVLIPIVLALTFKAPLWLFSAVVCVVAMLAMREYMDLVKAYGHEPLRLSTYLLVPLYFALLAVLGHDIIDPEAGAFFILLAGAFVLPVAFVYALLGLHKDLRSALPSVALSWTGFVLVAFALATLVLIRVLPLGPFYLLYLFVVVWSGDIVAFWVGSSIGKHKLAPEVSPKKTWEGAIASVVTAAVLGAVLLHSAAQIVGWLQGHGAGMSLDWAGRAELFQSLGTAPRQPDAFLVPFWKALLWSALINVAAQLGDLVESMMKRGAGVKDSGAILPGHGGMLDRVDALLFAAPFGFVIILFAIHS
ncbi:MAG TPA: phosphatidate cytidylyltransferase [Terriglobales bacterium]|nr:phosphatidate cytidylyltransferase [Terriglobales bacterium]